MCRCKEYLEETTAKTIEQRIEEKGIITKTVKIKTISHKNICWIHTKSGILEITKAMDESEMAQ